MKRSALLFIALCATACRFNSVTTYYNDFYSMLDEAWEFRLNESPLFATESGDTTRNNRLDTFTPKDIARRENYYNRLLERLGRIDYTVLNETDRINYDLFKYTVEREISYYKFKEYRIPILADDGFHVRFAQLPSAAPFNTEKDYRNYISRLKAFPNYVDQHIYWMREGLKDKFTLPRVVLNGYEVTISTHVVKNADSSVFFKPFRNMPSTITGSVKNSLIAEGRNAIMNNVVTGYETFLDFMNAEYIPGCRETIGAADLPNGKVFYEDRVKYFTTTSMSVDEIHTLGLNEVARIQREMDEVIKRSGFTGDRHAFIKFLRTDKRFYPATAEELLKNAAFIAKKMDARLPALFGKLPRQPYGVAPVPAHLAPKYTGGRYISSPINSKEPGYYWVNTYNLPSRPLYILESLTLHEAVPGHHLQIALSQELDDLPKFRQYLYIDSFGEGWGLYAEWLGKEAGFYQDPYAEFGRLTYEMWRACRLVVDTGLHAKGWTRQQVIDYLAENTALSLHECTTETDRYISWPGQALAYKIGELKIRELRKKVEMALGKDFDVRAFHDKVLSEGAVTMPLLEGIIDEFIASRK